MSADGQGVAPQGLLSPYDASTQADPDSPNTPSHKYSDIKATRQRSMRITDLAGVLHIAASPISAGAPPQLKAQRVVLLVEITPKIKPEHHAFRENLNAIGAIIVYGHLWRYMVIKREDNPPRSWSEVRDPTYRDGSHHLPHLPQSDSSNAEDGEEEHLLDVDPNLPDPTILLTNDDLDPTSQEFELLDSEGLFMDAFRGILRDLKAFNSDIWLYRSLEALKRMQWNCRSPHIGIKVWSRWTTQYTTTPTNPVSELREDLARHWNRPPQLGLVQVIVSVIKDSPASASTSSMTCCAASNSLSHQRFTPLLGFELEGVRGEFDLDELGELTDCNAVGPVKEVYPHLTWPWELQTQIMM
ncbi:hypothetical protein BDN67DRAFT_978774 [Paxillus ammoniavirescens]|nr:hypothetical protein BDN67DRAFT_978774 [Paxillus ammoniavirescens]